jgi:hypothetical protein
VYFPKWGIAEGRDQIGQMCAEVGATLKWFKHDYANFNWIISGGDTVVAEGTSYGEHQDGPWRGGTELMIPALATSTSRPASSATPVFRRAFSPS